MSYVLQASGVRLRGILHGVDFEVERGRFVTIIGPSGCGKSTLLRLLCRLVDYDSGQILFEGRALQDWDVLQLRKKVRMVFQRSTMVAGTVFDNLALADKGLLRAEAAAILASLGLGEELLDRDSAQLSGGQQARVALGRALVDRPEVLLLDEVTAALDPVSKALIEQHVQLLHGEGGLTVLWVTHDLAQAERLGQWSWVIADGKIAAAGPTPAVFASGHPFGEEETDA
jgi:putative ABC transport system ATP-binding protein